MKRHVTEEKHLGNRYSLQEKDKRTYRKSVVKYSLTIILITVLLIQPTLAQPAVTFPDLQDAWSKDAISWAVNKSIVGGYPDGTFKPRADVLEAEWTAMMFKYLEPGKKLDPPASGHHWSESIYNHIEHYKLPMRGHQTVTARNIPLKRVEIAKITSALYGFNLSEAQAVEFMYDNNFSSGMGGGRYYHTYGVDQNLQRQQAVMFLMKVDNQVKAKGGVTFRGKFYAMASGPIGIPDGGLKFPNTTEGSIDWARFNTTAPPTGVVTAPQDAGFPMLSRYSIDYSHFVNRSVPYAQSKLNIEAHSSAFQFIGKDKTTVHFADGPSPFKAVKDGDFGSFVAIEILGQHSDVIMIKDGKSVLRLERISTAQDSVMFRFGGTDKLLAYESQYMAFEKYDNLYVFENPFYGKR